MKLENITKSFNGKEIISEFTRDIPDGKITYIMGASGIGKTTLLRIIAGIKEMDLENPEIIVPEYNNSEFENIAKGLEDLPEGGSRCKKCYRLRLERTAQYAKENSFDFFTTTLSVSPYKNAEALNNIGGDLEREFGIKYLYSDFKKKEGYKRSCELSRKYNLYRQNYCGCIYSKRIAEQSKEEKL